MKSFSKNHKIIIDKMPQNFLYLGLIFSCFPEATVIHVKRLPEAVCWSNFKQNFTDSSLGYAYDIDDIVQYYKLYADIMSFWRRHYGEKIYELQYETLTLEQDRETRKIISHLGLDWDDKCLKPQNNPRYINTNSSTQIRKGVYQGSSEDWKKYKQYLSEAFRSLSDINF